MLEINPVGATDSGQGADSAQTPVGYYEGADAGERARRRSAELSVKGMEVDVQQVQQAIETRDKSDERRACGPLRPAEGALVVDTTGRSVEEVVDEVYRRVEERCRTNR